ncbi:MAG: class I adenylate-forming enzyme family protein [Acidimicrobiia bacterium]
MPVPRPVDAERAARYRAEGYWDTGTLADGIEAAAHETPGALALADDTQRLTWAELRQRVHGARSSLRAWGVGPGDAIVLVTGNTADGVIAYHAALRAGACVILLDRRCGRADLDFARSLVTGDLATLIPRRERERLALDSSTYDLESLSSTTVDDSEIVEPDRDAAAVVLLTSGTTGRPKAVVHSLNTLAHGTANMVAITGCTGADVLYLVSPLTSITGVMKMSLSVDRHAPLVMTDTFDPSASLDQIAEYGATVLGGAPVIVERLLAAAQARGITKVSLRTLPLGGAMLPRPLLELARDHFGIEAARVYGSSEAPNFSGSRPSDTRDEALADDGTITDGGEVRIGSSEHPDEGLLRGPGLFLGYLDAADNAAAFEGDWFRTGDLLEVNAGRITVIGRLKDIVNRNGLKFSPAEIDLALAGYDKVIEVSSYGCADPETTERLAVAVRPREGQTVTLDDVVAYLVAQGVAVRKLPEELVVWDEPLPRTASGKVVRSQLVREAAGKHAETVARLKRRR